MKSINVRKSMIALLLPLVCIGMVSCHGNKTTEASCSNDSDSVLTVTAIDMTDAPFEVRQYKYGKSTKYAEVGIDITVPAGTDGVSAAVRSVLFAEVDKNFGKDMGGERCIARYNGDMADVKKWITYYGSSSISHLSALCRDDIASNSAGEEDVKEENSITVNADIHSYALDLTITKDKYETSSFVVFNVVNYSDYGGAHPNSLAYGLVFNKKTGRQIKDLFVSGADSKMQSIIRKGLVRYFKTNGENVNANTLNEFLMLEGRTIPLPVCSPVPSDKGLVFTYQQYEIAAYVYGMPSFVVPYNEVMPFLTSEAKSQLGL